MDAATRLNGDSDLPEINRMLPQSADAEQGALCSLLLSPRWAFDICQEKGIRGEHFHIPAHRSIFETVGEMIDGNQPTDIVTVTQRLRDLGRLDQCGGAAFITEIFTFLPTAANVLSYVDILEQKRTLRRIIEVGTEHASRGYDDGDHAALLESLETSVLSIRQSDDGELKEMSPKEGAMGAITDIERLYENRGAITGIGTGFGVLDKMTDGLHGGEMFVIAARPSMGKTAFGMNLAEHIALALGKPVAVFSAEMSARQLHQRLLCSVARTNIQRVSDGFLSERDFPALTAAAGKIATSQLIIVDAVGASIGAVRAKARRMHRKHNLAAVLVDFIQCLRSTSKQALGSREREISEISQGLKNLAKEMDVPIIVLAQLNRDVEKRSGNRPRLSDLRESGSIEQDADVVGLLFRPAYYAETDDKKKELEGLAELIIAKSRNGPTGDVPLTFVKEYARFFTRAAVDEANASPQNEVRTWND